MDEIVEQDGITIIIDKKAQLTLLGTEMDFVESKLASEFVFNNPNITGTCGCGESFSVWQNRKWRPRKTIGKQKIHTGLKILSKEK